MQLELPTAPGFARDLPRMTHDLPYGEPVLMWVLHASQGFLVHGTSRPPLPRDALLELSTVRLDIANERPLAASLPGVAVVHQGRLAGLVQHVFSQPEFGAQATSASAVNRFLRRALRPAEHDPDVFVAYAPERSGNDGGASLDLSHPRVVACAHNARLRLWFPNQHELQAGDTFSDVMLRLINNAQGALLLFTPESRSDSLFAQREQLAVAFRRWAMPDFPCLVLTYRSRSETLPPPWAGLQHVLLDAIDDAEFTQLLRDTFDSDDAPHLIARRPELLEAHLRRELAPLNLDAGAVDTGIEALTHRGLDAAVPMLGDWVSRIPSHDPRGRSIIDLAAMLALPVGPALQTLRDAAVAEPGHRAVYLNAMPVQFAHLLVRKAWFPRPPMPCADIRDPQWPEADGIERIVAQVVAKISAALVCSDADARWLLSTSTACFAVVFATRALPRPAILERLQEAMPGALLVFLGDSSVFAKEQSTLLGIQPLALEPPNRDEADMHWVQAYKRLLERVAPRGGSAPADDHQPTVFVGAVFGEMRAHEVVAEALHAQGMDDDAHDAALADSFDLGDYLRQVASSDAFIGIVGERYGHIPRDRALNPEGHSLLKLAYEKARDAKLPCLLFFKAPGSNGASSAATDTDARQVAAFRSRLQRKILVVHSFTTPDELREQLRSSLAQLRSELDARASKARPTQRRATPKRRAPPK